MENRRTTIPALRPLEDTDVTTWELPEWRNRQTRTRIAT